MYRSKRLLLSTPSSAADETNMAEIRHIIVNRMLGPTCSKTVTVDSQSTVVFPGYQPVRFVGGASGLWRNALSVCVIVEKNKQLKIRSIVSIYVRVCSL